jgi:hypothetical protein
MKEENLMTTIDIQDDDDDGIVEVVHVPQHVAILFRAAEALANAERLRIQSASTSKVTIGPQGFIRDFRFTEI